MGGKRGRALENIRKMCRVAQLDEKTLLDQTRQLLGVYRNVRWVATRQKKNIADSVPAFCGDELNTMLTWLETIVPGEKRPPLEKLSSKGLEANQLVELIRQVMPLVRDYPEQGEVYALILSKCYLEEDTYQEKKLIQMLNMERSCYYDRKREAILLFGLTLWGIVLPELERRRGGGSGLSSD